jgi:hypothetical protein
VVQQVPNRRTGTEPHQHPILYVLCATDGRGAFLLFNGIHLFL